MNKGSKRHSIRFREKTNKGQTIGKLKVWRGENLALEVPLQAAEDIGKGTMSQRAMDGATELMIGLLRAGVSKL